MTQLTAGLAVALVLGADQLSKSLVLSRRRCILNAASFASNRVGLLLLWGVAVSSGVLLLSAGGSLVHTPTAVGVGLVLGGATGNFLDRVFRGAVVDFIDVGFWPVFNLADAGIVTGFGLVLAGLLE